MKTKILIFCVLGVGALAGAALAQHRTIDLKDYDDDLMHDVDRALKNFEPDVTAKNADRALDDAGVIQEGFKYSEDYFTKKGGTQDAVKVAQDGLTLIATAIEALNQKDFATATTIARQIPGTCKACHEIYKPLIK